MAHYPRWVKSSRVDSSAMFGAYLDFLGKCVNAVERENLAHLYIINHKPYFFTAGGNPQRTCTTAGCQRCDRSQGGYMFRWYDVRWESAYCREAKDGAWMPEEEEDGVDVTSI